MRKHSDSGPVWKGDNGAVAEQLVSVAVVSDGGAIGGGAVLSCGDDAIEQFRRRSWSESWLGVGRLHGEELVKAAYEGRQESVSLLEGADASDSEFDDQTDLEGLPEAFYAAFGLR